jgi:hypothetical protein
MGWPRKEALTSAVTIIWCIKGVTARGNGTGQADILVTGQADIHCASDHYKYMRFVALFCLL